MSIIAYDETILDGPQRSTAPFSVFCFGNQMAWYGMQPRNKGQKITVVTFGRAGEDNKSFKLSDIETTIAGFAGADYDLYVILYSTHWWLSESNQ